MYLINLSNNQMFELKWSHYIVIWYYLYLHLSNDIMITPICINTKFDSSLLKIILLELHIN